MTSFAHYPRQTRACTIAKWARAHWVIDVARMKLEGATLIRTDLETVEMVKCGDNSWYALMGTLCKPLGLDAHKVRKISCQDRKLKVLYARRLGRLCQGL